MNCTGDCCMRFLFIDNSDGEIRSGCCPTEIDLLKAGLGEVTIIRCDPVPNGSTFTKVTDDAMAGEPLPMLPCCPVGGFHKFD